MKITVTMAAKIMNKGPQFVRIGVQRNLLPFGIAMKQKGNSRFDYFINPNQLAEYLGISLDELKRRCAT